MKKFLITISPICVILLISMWISWGLEGVLLLFCVALAYVFAFGFVKWVEFVDKHIKD